MQCFSLAWLENMLIWLVIVILIVAIFKLVIPFLLNILGAPPGGGMIMTILTYLIWALVTIAVIIFVFEMISCAFGGGSAGFGNFGRIR